VGDHAVSGKRIAAALAGEGVFGRGGGVSLVGGGSTFDTLTVTLGDVGSHYTDGF